MSEIPSDLRFNQSHEWARREDGNEVTIGISDHAQEQLGDLVFVELPEVGADCVAGKEVAVVESVKAASDVVSPFNGTVTAVNEKLNDAPETVNGDPYGNGWLFKMELNQPSELDALMDADSYAEHVESEEH